MQIRRDKAVDPITVEVIRNFYAATAQQMTNVLVKGAFTPAIYEMKDFSLGLFTRDAELIAEGRALAVFLGSLTFAIQDVVKYVGEENLEEGDLVLSTHPYWIGSHPQDATMIRPIFIEGRLFGYAAAKAHWLDLGAKYSYGTDTTDVFQEGLQLFGVKLVKRGVLDREIVEIIRANTRTPSAVVGDMAAQISCCEFGAQRVKSLVAKYGADTVEQSVREALAYGEAIARREIASMPDGEWTAEAGLDNDGVSDEPIPIKVSVKIAGDEMHIDTTGSAKQQIGPVNCPLGRTMSTARLVMKMIVAPEYPANEGFFRPVKVHAPLGSMYNPVSPAATFIYGLASRPLGEAMFKALAQAVPHRSVAGSGGEIGICSVWHQDRDSGIYRGGGWNEATGQGASWNEDGESALANYQLGDSRNVPIEIIEERYPVLMERYELWQDSAGPGKFRGGLGVRRRWRSLTDVSLTSGVDQTRFPPFGVSGGKSAFPNTITIGIGTPHERQIRKISGYQIRSGEIVEYRMGGGGGWGDPLERDPEAVLADVSAGYVSVSAARSEYGVVIKTSLDGSLLEIDHEETRHDRKNRSLGSARE